MQTCSESVYLLGLINELSKNDKGITVLEEKSEFMKSLDQSFKELQLAKEGKIKLKSARELLEVKISAYLVRCMPCKNRQRKLSTPEVLPLYICRGLPIVLLWKIRH
ncbi:MAG: hypothetical protein K9G67_10370 [Bacteroidales bacterium]|nr:hypothetical protein [Bacteroidales bacterium]MCF8343800.1 hypothetical protein [Bacteroidales bacterium]MCF8376749.1 hypothetical protein [Bacteroidales bacterium]